MARRFFNKEHHFNTPRLENGEVNVARFLSRRVVASPKA